MQRVDVALVGAHQALCQSPAGLLIAFTCRYADSGKKKGIAGVGSSLTMPCQKPASPAWKAGSVVVGLSIVWGSVPGSTVVVVVVGATVVDGVEGRRGPDAASRRAMGAPTAQGDERRRAAARNHHHDEPGEEAATALDSSAPASLRPARHPRTVTHALTGSMTPAWGCYGANMRRSDDTMESS